MELDDLYVLPQFRNNRIRTAVLKRFFSKTGFPIFLYVFQKNVRAVSLYSKLRFKVVENIGNTRYKMQRDP